MWYEDPQLKCISEKADRAYDDKNADALLEISEECRLLASSKELHDMIRAKLYYDSFTCISNYIGIKKIKGIEREKYLEKTLYLCRKSLKLQEQYYSKKNFEGIEINWYKAINYQTRINYCNILVNIGRISRAIYEIRKIALKGHGMAMGNLGLELLDYSILDYDKGHGMLMREKTCSLLKYAISAPDDEVHHINKKKYHDKLISILGEDDIDIKFDNINEPTFKYECIDKKYLDYYDDLPSDELYYRKWITSNGLALNTLNDFDYSINQAYDPIHLPNMITDISQVYPPYHGLFNQIKQEYCSARFMIYDGINTSEMHYSDKDVYMVNTLDYPVYGLGIEKIKSGYRSIYALFDRIGYFLNEYFSLGFGERQVCFRKVWNRKSKLNEIAEENYILKGLHWIEKDLHGNFISDYKEHIDATLNRTYDIRNIIEHRYLKILTYAEKDVEKSYSDELAYVISKEEFENLVINLLRISRESIILLVMVINIEENKKKKNIGENRLMNMYLSKYEDEWKI